MTTLLDRIHAEIRERMERYRPAAEEYQRLEAALAVLDSAPRRPSAEAPRPTLVEAAEAHAPAESADPGTPAAAEPPPSAAETTAPLDERSPLAA
jgi:hypothetical protein